MCQRKNIALFAILLAALACKANPTRDAGRLDVLKKMPAACNGKFMCHTKSQYYPEDVIEELLNRSNDLYDQPVTVQDRDGGDGEPSDCETHRSINPIYEIIDKNDTVRFVVQSRSKFKQIIKTEECMETKPKTLHFTEQILDLHKLQCIAKTINYKFLVLSLDHQRLETAEMKGGVPVCCSCQKSE